MNSLRLCCLLVFIIQPCCALLPHQATGVRVGEVSDTSAIVWVRLTKEVARKTDGIVQKGRNHEYPNKLPQNVSADQLQHACPGAAGKVQLRIGKHKDLSDAKTLGWFDVGPKRFYTSV